jgi:dTDP-4-dehydrorhamnose 3,5-epimerase
MLASGGPPVVETIDAEPGEAVLIPEGVAHGFLARDALTLVYLVTNEYDGTDELGFAWNDPLAAVPWPVAVPRLSDRDADAGSLADLVATLRAQDQQIVGR